jgi:peptidoglycan L-alanyl-D-glutamate endopeptidase CwlK
MPSFGKRSRERLDTCHKDLQRICERVVKSFDISVVEGHRTLEKQKEYYESGLSKLDGVAQKSKHQSFPSMAVDIAPYPIDFADKHKKKARFYMMAGYIFMAADDLYREGKVSHKLRWGGDWDSDKDFDDQTFDDLPHFELVEA